MIPKVIDLFSGCGGLALGFEKAGFEIAGGLEIIPEACDTATSNLCWRYGKSQGSHITAWAGYFQKQFWQRGLHRNRRSPMPGLFACRQGKAEIARQ